jgi:ABC-type multidrug transport system fused ATPase/permease subunit
MANRPEDRDRGGEPGKAGVPTKWAIDRLDEREKRFSFAAAGAAALFGTILYFTETNNAHFHPVKGQFAPLTTLVVSLVAAAMLLGTTLIGRRALVGFVALFTFLAFGNSALVLGFPFLALAVWLLFRSYKVQKEAAANVRAAKASGSAGGASTTGSPAARSAGKVETKGRAKKGPVTPEANKRYTPKRPAPPAPPPPKPSWRERRAAKAGD